MQWTDDLKIETPEQIDVSLEIAGLGSRFVAQIWDWIFKGLMFGMLALVTILLLALLSVNVFDPTIKVLFLTAAFVVTYTIFLGYDIYFEVHANGQTPGKKAAGIRVIREGGAPQDFRSACIRNFLCLADFLPGFYLLGGFFVLLSSRGQRLGDMAAGTIVIRERSLQAPADLENDIEIYASDEFRFTADQLTACPANTRYILRTFFERLRNMDPYPRNHLAGKLAEEFLRKTSYQPISPLNDGQRSVAFLASLYRDMEHLARHNVG